MLGILEKLPDQEKSIPVKFYFDNYFTGLPLIIPLKGLNYGATGTIKDNRIPKSCVLQLVIRIKMDLVGDTVKTLILARWKDNSIVTMTSILLQ